MFHRFVAGRVGLALCALLVPACGGGGSGGGSPAADPGQRIPPPAPEEPPAPPVSRTFDVDWSVVPNPERGFYEGIDLVNGRDFRWLRTSKGFTLGLAIVTLSPYRYGPIPEGFLTSLNQGFDAVRASGIKVVLRFRYATYSGEADAPKNWILHHVGQLTPLLQAHGDVIAVLQAGFIGTWGEWHHSTHGLGNTADRREILLALLRALPASRSVQVRIPHFKRDIFQRYTPIAAAEAFSGSDTARVGHHNDAFLMGDHDGGTYIGDIPGNMSFIAEEGRFVPVGGETNRYYNPSRIPGLNATYELSRFHYSFLSGVYYSGVLNNWRQSGHYAVIQRQLGYVFSLVDASWTEAAKPGGTIELAFRVKNGGYASAYNERPVYLILQGNGAWHAARIGSADPRRWEANGEVSLSARFRLPAGLPAGTYRLSLWLPDAAASLRDRPEYSVRLANLGTWDPQTAQNAITESFRIDPSAPGPSDPSSASFVEIP